jgi:hypothetical protein
MPPKLSPHGITAEQRAEFEALADELREPSGYRWLTPFEIPSAIPEKLRQSLTSALLMWEHTSTGAVFIVCNGIRLDSGPQELDQEPMGIAVHSSGASDTVLFLHHGAWAGRTVPITPEVRIVLASTSMGNFFPLGEVPSPSGGRLAELARTSHEGAFRSLVEHLCTAST